MSILVNSSFDFTVHKFYTSYGVEENIDSINSKIRISHKISSKLIFVALAKGEKFDYTPSSFKKKICFFFVVLNFSVLDFFKFAMDKYNLANPLLIIMPEYECPLRSSSSLLCSTNMNNKYAQQISSSVFQAPVFPRIEVSFSNSSSKPSYSSNTPSSLFCNSPYFLSNSKASASFSPMSLSNIQIPSNHIPHLPLFPFAPLPPPFFNSSLPISQKSMDTSDKSNITFVINVPKNTSGLVVIPNKSNKKKGHNFIFTRKDDIQTESDVSLKKENNLDVNLKEEFGLNSSSDMSLKSTENTKEIVPLLEYPCEIRPYKHKTSKLSNYLWFKYKHFKIFFLFEFFSNLLLKQTSSTRPE